MCRYACSCRQKLTEWVPTTEVGNLTGMTPLGGKADIDVKSEEGHPSKRAQQEDASQPKTHHPKTRADDATPVESADFGTHSAVEESVDDGSGADAADGSVDEESEDEEAVRESMSLTEFQNAYISEDNAEFFKLLEVEQKKRDERLAWMSRVSDKHNQLMLERRKMLELQDDQPTSTFYQSRSRASAPPILHFTEPMASVHFGPSYTRPEQTALTDATTQPALSGPAGQLASPGQQALVSADKPSSLQSASSIRSASGVMRRS